MRVQIMGIEPQPGDPPDSGLPLLISDSRHLIICRMTPSLLSKFAKGAFQKHTIIDIQSLTLKIACTFDFVYLLVDDCNFSASLQLLPVLEADYRRLADINKHRVVRDAMNKYRVVWSIHFPPSPHQQNEHGENSETENSGWDFNAEVGVLSGALPAHSVQLFDEWGSRDAAFDDAMCAESEDENENVNENESECKRSDKEENEEEEEEEEAAAKEREAQRRRTGNGCDWLHFLFPRFQDVPNRIKQQKVAPMKKPTHTPTKQRTKRKRPSTNTNKASEVENFSQTSFGSSIAPEDMIEALDAAEAQFNASKAQKKKEMSSEKTEEEESEEKAGDFEKPTYSLTERMASGRAVSASASVNDSILSVQESVDGASQNGERILTLPEEMELDEDDADRRQQQRLEAVEEEEHPQQQSQPMEEDEEDQEEEQPIDPAYLGEITRSDLNRVFRYLVRVGKELNRGNDTNPNNPFRFCDCLTLRALIVQCNNNKHRHLFIRVNHADIPNHSPVSPKYTYQDVAATSACMHDHAGSSEAQYQ